MSTDVRTETAEIVKNILQELHGIREALDVLAEEVSRTRARVVAVTGEVASIAENMIAS